MTLREWMEKQGFKDFNTFVKEQGLDFTSAMKEHYKRALVIADKQKMCLNPYFPKDFLPKEIADLSLSTLNPISKIDVKEGSFILDIGCGAGADCFLAAKMAGPKGLAIGIDPSEELIERAKLLKDKYKIDNVEFKVGTSEPLAFEDNYFDIIISNHSFHLFNDKLKSLIEAKRVLKSGGKVAIGDSFTPCKIKFTDNPEQWFYSAGGAVSTEELKEMAGKAGFRDCSFIKVDYPELPELIEGYMILEK